MGRKIGKVLEKRGKMKKEGTREKQRRKKDKRERIIPSPGAV